MIILFEQDIRRHKENNNRLWNWKPLFFQGRWKGKKTYRIGWGLWTFSYYPEPGLKDFLDYVKKGNTQWHDKTQKGIG